jgi:hypothetical protein
METTIIKLKTDDGIFEPDRISGKREDIENLGIEILGYESTYSYMWDFECVDIRVPDKTFEVELHFDENGYHSENEWYGDVCFDGFALGYVEKSDFEIISGYNPFIKVKT